MLGIFRLITMVRFLVLQILALKPLMALPSLAREICQNSIDANLKNGEPTRIIFRTFEIAPSAIPGFDDLDDAFSRSLEYWSKQKSTKAKSFFQSALKLAKQPKITCLRISDTNTTGLLGSDEEYNSPWCNLRLAPTPT